MVATRATPTHLPTSKSMHLATTVSLLVACLSFIVRYVDAFTASAFSGTVRGLSSSWLHQRPELRIGLNNKPNVPAQRLLTTVCAAKKGKPPKVSKKPKQLPMTPASADMSKHITVDLQFPGLKLVHRDPPVFTINNFFDSATCEEYMKLGPDGEEKETSLRVDSATFGGGFTAANRQSTTWFLRYEKTTALLSRVLKLLPELDVEQCEEPQIVRYEMGDFFNWHEDKLPDCELENGGQRVATLLVYLNQVPESGGGATTFKDLDLKVQPEQGKALLFFPAFADGEPDERTLHAGSPAFDTKWIAQMWVHQKHYSPAVPRGNSHKPAAEQLQALTAVKEQSLAQK